MSKILNIKQNLGQPILEASILEQIKGNVPKVFVAVSDSMGKLRRMQGVMNDFWQTTDLSYGYFLSHADSVFADTQRRTVELLGHIQSEVWYPNDQNRIKRDDTIWNYLDENARKYDSLISGNPVKLFLYF
jgi:hypothetical protein